LGLEIFNLKNIAVFLINILNLGRPSLYKKDPNILEYVRDFIDTNIDTEAEYRRRNSVEYCQGFSLPQLREYVIKRYYEEKNQQLTISKATLSRLFNAPNKTFKSSSYYKGIFDIQRCGGKNDHY
jgi:hypothetical protein